MEIAMKVERVVAWLREQVEESGTTGLVVGISGGIDSAVVANLIYRAFPNQSLGVILPIRSHQDDIDDGLAVAIACGIKHTTVNLDNEHENVLSKAINALQKLELYDENKLRISDANLRARLRMSTLYTIANNVNSLVVGTDNAAELHTGYFTKYGDGGVDILPIAGLTKREVYQWGEYLGVPQSVLNREPSAGLWEGQTDEKEMGTTYEMIDDFLEGKEVPQKDKEIIERLHGISHHKRVMPPLPNI
ncbi:NAD+ synthetase [Alkaliphilus metalliredigens QYMF]|uniref:NH(3)-dependent NAD(+) synthetase n=1 Tax=Alkaliphilus metalliredigens (strain QYMF) TaxID=293826 RepID=NADE_ALKMQ|nr:RecName: Full=NH(3)-dependent NAD(+) synthetase [Alkaliphilus metalliredigens QYMF]ABR48392.1 NAD+ synthetase [Alkaliphilus metalliredigens QYMF]